MQPVPNSTPSQQGARPSPRARNRSPPAKRRRTTLPTSHSFPTRPPFSSSSPPSQSPSRSRCSSPTPASASVTTNDQPTLQSPAKWFRKPSVVWYRGNDLRVEDHPALLAAAQRGGPVVPFFVWDDSDGFGLGLGSVKQWWLRESLKHLRNDLRRLGVRLYTRTGRSTDELRAFLEETGADAVFWNRCYEPDLLKRDEELRAQLAHEGFTAESFKAELLLEPWELSNTSVSPCFETFQAYKRAWLTFPPPPQPFPCPSHLLPIARDVKSADIEMLGFDIPASVERSMKKIWKPGSVQAKIQLDKFLHEVFPAFGEVRFRRHFDGTSRLSPHIRFGELSPRRMYHSTRLRVSQWDQTAAQYSARQNAATRGMPATKRTGVERTKDNRLQDKAASGESTVLHAQGSRARESSRECNGKNAREDLKEKQDECGAVREQGDSKADTVRGNSAPRDRRKVSVKRLSIPPISSAARAFLNNLCLRDFAYHVLFHNPEFNTRPLIPEFNRFPWAQDNGSFDSWKNGVTGYPLVDAAMRELHETGWIHNRMRHLLACFLTKYLLLPWSRGLKAFYGMLVDGDHSSNALGWQWTSGSNTDAFPFSCLVNPVNFAYYQDPTGSYVRKWIPELAKLPTEFIHEPWKAPKELLKEHGITIGATYPQRIVLTSEARSRASNAMSVMKRIFAASTVRRSVFIDKDNDTVREWPDSKPEVLQMDGAQPLSGKTALISSLWTMLRDPTPTYLSSNPSGSDALIAMDMASLVEGALPVSLDEQHESIEHALITAHEQCTTESPLAAVAYIDGSSFSPDPECEPGAELRTNAAAVGMDIQQLEEPLKYTNSEMNAFPDQGKQLQRHHPGDSVPLSNVDSSGNSMRGNEELQQIRSVRTGFVQVSQGANFVGTGGQYSQNPPPQLQQPMQQLQQFQQLHALGVQHAQQQQTLEQMRQSNIATPGQSQLRAHQPPQRPQDVHPQSSHPQHDRLTSQIHQTHNQRQMLQPGQAQGLQQQLPSIQQTQRLQRPHQTPHSHAQNPIDGLSNPSVQNSGLHGTNVAGVPLAAAPVMIGAVSSGPDLPTGHALGNGDPSAAVYSHHLGMNQFYGFQPVMPLMNASHLHGADRFDTLGVSAAANSQKLTVPGMMPFGYGMYGGGVFDPNAIGNSFAPNGNSYVNGPTNVQNQAHPSQHTQYGLPPHALYCSQPSSADVIRAQRDSRVNGQRESQKPAYGIGHQESVESSGHRPQVQTAVHIPAGAVEERETAPNISNEGFRHREKQIANGSQSAEDHGPQARGSGTPANSLSRSPRASGSLDEVAKASSSHKATKLTARGRQSSRGKRMTKGMASNKPNVENRGQGGMRGRGGDKSLQRSKASPADKKQVTTLKSRREMLSSVLASKDHEYNSFAQYLSVTYELTGNTDRQTSRDYVRLCNLKDSYHRQYPAEKDKLKIYSMKRFFSQYLNLEVTGEWDRHNHGGVRGPYVYGIRARTQAESSGAKS